MGTEHYQGELEEFKSEVIAKTIKELVVFEQTEDE
jgi:hypothetical protein